MQRYIPLFSKLQEKIPLSISKHYVKDWNKSRLSDWFDNKYRIYLPLKQEESLLASLKSDLEKDIELAISHTQFKIKDYKSGVAIDTKNNRDIKLGKVLQRIDPKLLQQFSSAEDRMGTKMQKLEVVISRHPYDIAGQSYDRGWTSCKDLSGGNNSKFISSEVHSTLIAYLIYDNDKNIQKPIARILLNQFLDERGNVVYIPQISIYGTPGKWETAFIKTVDDWLESKQGRPTGTHKMNPFQYADSLPTSIDLITDSNLPNWVMYSGNIPVDFEYNDNKIFIWNNGIWKQGTWFNGIWNDGIWKTGTWNNGIWNGGTWEKGTWKAGKWNDGIWKDGWIYDPEKIGNFETDWTWSGKYIRSRVSPKEYFEKIYREYRTLFSFPYTKVI